MKLARGARIAGGIAALAAALALGLLARETQRWPARAEVGDVAFAAGKRDADWPKARRVHQRFAVDLLDVRDDVAFRRALRLVHEIGSLEAAPSSAEAVRRIGRAERALLQIGRDDPDRRRRSAAANLLGIVHFEAALITGRGAETALRASASAFERAVRLDPQNADAKFNLELLLELLRAQGDQLGWNPFRRGADRVGGGQPGQSPPGEGY